MTSKNVLYLASNLEDQETYNTLSMELTRTDSNVYYVYAKGKVLMATEDMAAAIQCADTNKGVVIGKELLYVWRLGESQTQEPLTIQ